MSRKDPSVDSKQIYKRLLSISMEHWPVFLLAALAMVVFAASDTGFAFLIKNLTDIVEAGDDLTAQQEQIKKWLPLGVLVLFLLRGAFGFLSSYGMGWIGQRAVLTLRGEVFEKYLTLPTNFFDRSSAGELLSKIIYDISQISEAASTVLVVLIRDTLTITGLVIFMIYLSPTLSGLVLVIAPLIALMVRFMAGIFRRHNTRIQSSVGSVTRIGEEALQGHKIIKIFNGQDYESSRFREANYKNFRLNMRLIATKAGGDGVTVLITAFGVAGVIYIVTQLTLSIGDVTGFLSAMVLLMAPLKRLTNLNASMQKGIAAGASIFGVLDLDSERDTGEKDAAGVQGTVEFRDVGFAYTADKGAVLSNVSFSVEAGNTLAIVGRSGSGKSTLVGLLPRFYDIDSGQICLDGTPVDEFTLGSLRSQISLVSQEVTLFNDTIANNIAYGGLSGASREDVEQAARVAHVAEFVSELPDGLDTVVGDRGLLL
ncbi:MAG: ABC transporter transmembrane domain-containing protein, partial [Gammaproteobacteria bacterium]